MGVRLHWTGGVGILVLAWYFLSSIARRQLWSIDDYIVNCGQLRSIVVDLSSIIVNYRQIIDDKKCLSSANRQFLFSASFI